MRRGIGENPPNRFERLAREPIDVDIVYDDERPAVRTTCYRDTTRAILAQNDSPDLPFRFSLNPYRGCEHGCVYCYARPSHEYLGFSAGLDFETKIMVKMDAAKLLDETLSAPSWQPQTVALSGNTDCYQPVERTLQLTRACLEVFLAHRNPVSIITKNALVTRDIDLLRQMAAYRGVRVMISLITLNPELTRAMEPHASMPALRLQAMAQLAAAGIPVGINVAPVIPGLTDDEIPAILEAASLRGATRAACSPVRLPGAVAPLFTAWIQQTFPDRAAKVLHRIEAAHGGQLNDSRFGSRMTGEGTAIQAVHDLFAIHARKFRLNAPWEELSTAGFRRKVGDQLDLFF